MKNIFKKFVYIILKLCFDLGSIKCIKKRALVIGGGSSAANAITYMSDDTDILFVNTAYKYFCKNHIDLIHKFGNNFSIVIPCFHKPQTRAQWKEYVDQILDDAADYGFRHVIFSVNLSYIDLFLYAKSLAFKKGVSIVFLPTVGRLSKHTALQKTFYPFVSSGSILALLIALRHCSNEVKLIGADHRIHADMNSGRLIDAPSFQKVQFDVDKMQVINDSIQRYAQSMGEYFLISQLPNIKIENLSSISTIPFFEKIAK